MRTYVLTATAAAALCAVGVSGALGQFSNDGKDRWMVVENSSKHTATSIYIVPSKESACCWSRDLLEVNDIPPKKNFVVNFDDGSGECKFDIRVTSERAQLEWHFDGIDVCNKKGEQRTIVLQGVDTLINSKKRLIKIKNETTVTAHSIYSIPTNKQCCWSHNLLGEDRVIVGTPKFLALQTSRSPATLKTRTPGLQKPMSESAVVNLDDGTGACQLDLRIVGTDGRVWNFDRLRICGSTMPEEIVLKDVRRLGEQDRRMRISNRSGISAYFIYTIPSWQPCCWSHDILGEKVLISNDSFYIDFDDGSPHCIWDVHVMSGRDTEWHFDRIDVCDPSRREIVLKK
jgi:hypothetical protein